MQLNACTHGALRILMACAEARGEPVTMVGMAQSLGLTEALVVKACHRLMRAGYLKDMRGRGGGYLIGRPAEGITLLEVVRLFEDEDDLFPCRLKADGDCRIAAICRLRVACDQAHAAFSAVLRDTTIADLTLHAPPTPRREPIEA
jgi:Rrf2 family nitric oxide-sensitive transcriptional repressor